MRARRPNSSAGRDRALKNLRNAGCRARWVRRDFGRLNVRDHRKIIVIDGRLAFVGGHCVTDDWLKGHDGHRCNRDISARITDEVFNDESTFPELQETGAILTHAAFTKSARRSSPVQVLHHLCIGYAKQRIRIQNPYFLPDPRGAKALVRTAKRGVDVRVMTPSFSATDSKLVGRASRFQIRRLLEGGVRVFHYQPSLLHQKILVIDGLWSGIGSSNFDDRSFEINDEIVIGIVDKEIARKLEETFEREIENCVEVDLESWKHRPLWDKALDRILYIFSEQF